MVVIGTFEWCSIRLFGKVPLLDIITGISVAVITVLTDNLALAVIVGVILSALSFAWESANKIHLITKKDSDGNNIHEVHGTIFFCIKG